MRHHLLLCLVLATACGTTDPKDDPQPGDEQVMNPDPTVDVCSATDGVCLSSEQCATSDPDCKTSEPPPGCVPPVLPPTASNGIASVSALTATSAVTANATKMFMLAYNYGANAYQIYTCPLDGCPAVPDAFNSPISSRDSFIAAVGNYLYWSSKSDGAEYPNQVMRKSLLDGADAQPGVIFSVPGGSAYPDYYADISRHIGVYDDYALVIDASSGNTTTLAPESGIRAITDAQVTDALSGVQAPAYSLRSVAGTEDYVASWVDPVSTPVAPYDRKIHIFDLYGKELGATAEPYGTVGKMDIVGDKLLFLGDSHWYGCTLPGCSDVHDIGLAVKASAMTFTVGNGRVYFGALADMGCGQGNTGALASCTVDDLFSGTCTPTLHSTSIHWVNANTIAIAPNRAVATTLTNTTMLLSTAL